jgi:hypothetical protein
VGPPRPSLVLDKHGKEGRGTPGPGYILDPLGFYWIPQPPENPGLTEQQRVQQWHQQQKKRRDIFLQYDEFFHRCKGASLFLPAVHPRYHPEVPSRFCEGCWEIAPLWEREQWQFEWDREQPHSPSVFPLNDMNDEQGTLEPSMVLEDHKVVQPPFSPQQHTGAAAVPSFQVGGKREEKEREVKLPSSAPGAPLPALYARPPGSPEGPDRAQPRSSQSSMQVSHSGRGGKRDQPEEGGDEEGSDEGKSARAGAAPEESKRRRRKKKQKTAHDPEGPGVPSDNRVRCDVCDIMAPGPVAYEEHLRGRRHLQQEDQVHAHAFRRGAGPAAIHGGFTGLGNPQQRLAALINIECPFPGLGERLVNLMFPPGAWAPELSASHAARSNSESQQLGHVFRDGDMNRLIVQPIQRATQTLRALSMLVVDPSNGFSPVQWHSAASYVIASRARQQLRDRDHPSGELAAMHFAEVTVANVPRPQLLQLLAHPDAGTDPIRFAFTSHFSNTITPLLQQAWHSSRFPGHPSALLFEHVVQRMRSDINNRLRNRTFRPRSNSAPVAMDASQPAYLPAFPDVQPQPEGLNSQRASTLDAAVRDFRLGPDPDSEDAEDYDNVAGVPFGNDDDDDDELAALDGNFSDSVGSDDGDFDDCDY